MPGRIIEIAVASGQVVRQGDPLFMLEAMKMEHNVAAPFAGTVLDVCVSVGDQVSQGAVVVAMDPDDPGAE